MANEDKPSVNLSIDENNLPGEWQAQPVLMLEYGLLLADAEQEVDETKAKLAVVAAGLETDIRDNPDDYGLAKVTEAAVQATLPQQKQHQIATKNYNDAKHRARVYRAMVEAIAHRKSALQGMTDLYMRQWFADPTAREQAAQEAPKETKTISRRVPRRSVKS